MSVESGIRDKTGPLKDFSPAPSAGFSSDLIPYVLATADAVIILISSLLGAVGYQFLVGGQLTNALPHCALGLLAGVLYILRMKGSGYYDFPHSAKPRVEIGEILVCWSTTGLLLALIAFLLKVGVDFSRGAFVIFFVLASVGLLAGRKFTKLALAECISRGAIGRRDSVLVGDFDEIFALQPKDLLAFFGAAKVDSFALSREGDPSARLSTDSRILNTVCDFVRRNNCRELLLALPWDDVGRIEFVRNQIKSLPVAARLLPDIHVRSLTQFASSARQQILAVEI